MCRKNGLQRLMPISRRSESVSTGASANGRASRNRSAKEMKKQRRRTRVKPKLPTPKLVQPKLTTPKSRRQSWRQTHTKAAYCQTISETPFDGTRPAGRAEEWALEIRVWG